ncbi:MAG: T9SS type A sorting domain-containing protein, partial [Bacteroidota bacterium]
FRNKLPLGLITSGPGQAPSLIQVEPALGLQRIRIPRQVANVTLDPSSTILKGTASSISRLATLGVGLEELNVMNFNPYPNPVQGILQVDLNSAAELLLTDLSGRQINVYHGHEGKNQLDLHLPSGTYFLQALFPTGLRVSRRIVIP